MLSRPRADTAFLYKVINNPLPLPSATPVFDPIPYTPVYHTPGTLYARPLWVTPRIPPGATSNLKSNLKLKKMNEFNLARYRAKFTDQSVNSEPFLLSEGIVRATRAQELIYIIKLNNTKFQIGLGDLSDSLSLSLPEKMSVEKAQSALVGVKSQIVKGEWKRA